MRVLQINTTDLRGGAARIAWNLLVALRRRGHGSWLAVGRRLSEDPDVFAIRHELYYKGWARNWFAVGDKLIPLVGRVRGAGRLRRLLHGVGQPSRMWQIQLGREDFRFPGTWHILDLPPERPNLLHCHNLHGGYFDLRALGWLSQQLPTVLTLHDAWLLSGNCAHSFDCQRWLRGCGNCPDLRIYPSIRRDATTYNWRRKRDIYRRSRLYLTTPSSWLMEKVQHSMLSPAILQGRVIPNGVDISVFYPDDQQLARAELGLPREADVLLFTANRIRRNIWKDYVTMREALARLAANRNGRRVLFIALGEDAPAENIDHAEVRFVPYQRDVRRVARYYQAADVYVHAARADTFPNTVLEAMACGTPVVATDVGGIPEQIVDGETGFLTPLGDAQAMAARIQHLLAHSDRCQTMGQRAADDARRRFDLRRQAADYLSWYQEVYQDWSPAKNTARN